MPENALTIQIGEWVKATASGSLAVLVLAVIVIAWLAAFYLRASEASRKKSTGNSTTPASNRDA
jgi:hypothetical protein